MREKTLARWLCLVGAMTLASSAGAAPIDFTGYNAPAGTIESLLGTKVAELNAASYGFNFGTPLDPFRNANVISQVYCAAGTVSIGTGQNGTNIVLHAGDLTFAYTIDYTGTIPGLSESTMQDVQLMRVVDDQFFHTPPISNPGPMMAVEEIMAGAYNTAAGFSNKPLRPYSNGIGWTENDFPGYQSSYVQFRWPTTGKIMPGDKVQVFLFCTGDVDIDQIGWTPTGGANGEGGNFIGGVGLNDIPVLIPARAPEPASMAILLAGSVFLLNRRRSVR